MVMIQTRDVKTSTELDRKIIVQFRNAEGLDVGPEFQVPLNVSNQELKKLLHQVQKDEEPTPYVLKAMSEAGAFVEIQGTLEDVLKSLKGVTSEVSLKIMFYPLSTFRVRPSMRCTASIQGHSEAVLTLAFSPTSQYLASGSGDTTIRIWDLDTETPLKTLRGHKSWVLIVQWSPDGTLLASAGMDKCVKVWYPFESSNKDTVRCITLCKHTKPVTCLAWQPLHKITSCQSTPYLASGSLDSLIHIWNVASESCIRTLSGHTMPVTQLKFSGMLEKDYLYSVARDCYLKVWDIQTGDVIYNPKGHGHWINTLALNTDYILQYGHHDHTLECRLSKPLAEQILIAKKRYLDHLKKSCGGQERLVTGSDDCTMILWEPFGTKQMVAHLTGHQQPVNDVRFSPNGQYIATASFDKTLRLWDAFKGTYLAVFRGHVGRVYQIAWSPDSRYILSGSSDSTVKIWNVPLRKLQRDLPGHADEVFCVGWSADGAVAASGSKDFFLKIWKP